MHQYVERVVNLIDSDNNLIYNMTEEEARQRVWSADPKAVNELSIIHI